LLDRQEHYDIDGVTQRDGKLSFPLVIKNKKSLREISKRAGL